LLLARVLGSWKNQFLWKMRSWKNQFLSKMFEVFSLDEAIENDSTELLGLGVKTLLSPMEKYC
jgi:hypothetical protein